MQTIFGLPISQPFMWVLALAITLILLGIFAWILRRIVTGGGQGEGVAPGRQPRLGIVDTFAIDRQRQLVIVRRDSVEHLLLLGGTTDVVIESNLVRTQSNSQSREQMPASKSPAAPEVSRNSRPNSNMAELSFAPEPRDAPVAAHVMPTPPVQQPILQSMPKVTPVPRPSDLSEIANRFQNTTVSPLVAGRDQPSAPAPTTTTQVPPTPMTAHRDEEMAGVKQPEHEPEPSIPAPARPLTPPSAMPETRDIGSLNDTLRQLLGRTREP